MAFTVRDGRLRKDGEPFLALGVNYHPSGAGCDIWVDWDPETIKADFHRMADAGLNSVRLFLFWRDFQPEPHVVSEQALQRLDAVLAMAAEEGLNCLLSLLTVWMNGQLLDLPWRAGRSPWHDAELLAAQETLAGAVAARLRHHANVLAVDLGDELWNIDPVAARSLTRADVAQWQERLAAVVRSQAPGLPVLQANDASGVFAPVPYGADNSTGLDLIGTHGFPTWAPGSIESTLSYKATSLTAFQVRVAMAYGVVLVDELGSYGVNETTAAAYLGAAAASALANGAAGVFVWCWQDIASTRAPYRDRPAERMVGLHRLDGTPKPTMRRYAEVLARAAELSITFSRAPVSLCLTEGVRHRGSTYLDGADAMTGIFHAYLLARRAHLEVDITTTDTVGRQLVLYPSVSRLTITDLERMTEAAHRGATVYLSLGDHLHAFPGTELIGAEIVDFGLPEGKTELLWGNESWPIRWSATSCRPTTMRTTTARVLAHFPDGTPALVANDIGHGQILFCNAPFEQQLNEPGRLTSGVPHRFYQRLAEVAGVSPLVPDADPDLEVLVGQRDGRAVAILVNHGDTPVTAPDDGPPLEAKGWRVVDRLGTLDREG
ncbi:cellulase family glycosylhydrolase [Streptomyces sp. NPDC020731]|uniref:cellulase family glycosylhydrolase n=1 Tax=Streptomyces sp. NPDC020731 TaxID=3365085 RepID=UPI00378A03D9